MVRVAALLLLAGCSNVEVSTDHDPRADFSRLRTWDWFPGRPQEDTLTAVRVQRAVDDGLRARGYTRETGRPDFHVAYRTSVGRRVESIPASASYAYGWRRAYVVGGGSEIRTTDEGTLVLEIIDPAAKALLWRGTARSVIDPSQLPEEREARVREAVEKLLEGFPPGGVRPPEPSP